MIKFSFSIHQESLESEAGWATRCVCMKVRTLQSLAPSASLEEASKILRGYSLSLRDTELNRFWLFVEEQPYLQIWEED